MLFDLSLLFGDRCETYTPADPENVYESILFSVTKNCFFARLFEVLGFYVPLWEDAPKNMSASLHDSERLRLWRVQGVPNIQFVTSKPPMPL